MRQQGLPTDHTLIQRRAQSPGISGNNRIITILARLTQSINPFRIQILLTQRLIAIGSRRNRNHVDYILEPTRDIGIVIGLNMNRKIAALVIAIVIEPAHTWINQPDHILRTRRLNLAFIFNRVQFLHQIGRRTVGKSRAPEFHRNISRTRRHTAAIHKTAGGFKRNHNHRPGRRWIVL